MWGLRVPSGVGEAPFCSSYLFHVQALSPPRRSSRIRVADLGRPMEGHQKGLELSSVTVAPQELGVPSKTFSYDDTVIIDKPAWLGPILGELAEKRLPADPLLGLLVQDIPGWRPSSGFIERLRGAS